MSKQKWGICYIIIAIGILIVGTVISLSVRTSVLHEVQQGTKITTASVDYKCTSVKTDEWTDGYGKSRQKTSYTFYNKYVGTTCPSYIKIEDEPHEKGDIMTVVCADMVYPKSLVGLLEDKTDHIEIINGDKETVMQQALNMTYKRGVQYSVKYIFFIALITLVLVLILLYKGIENIKYKEYSKSSEV